MRRQLGTLSCPIERVNAGHLPTCAVSGCECYFDIFDKCPGTYLLYKGKIIWMPNADALCREEKFETKCFIFTFQIDDILLQETATNNIQPTTQGKVI